jgi:hypothetical protein
MISDAIRGIVDIRCRLELSYASEEEAENVLRAVEIDNEGFVRARREGSSIVSDISSESILGLVHTIEDYLACASVAEKTIRTAGGRPRVHEPPRPARKRASRRGS